MEAAGDNGAAYDGFVADLFAGGGTRKRLIGELVNYFVTSAGLVEREQFAEPLLRYNAELPEEPGVLLKELKKVVREHVIESPGVQHLEFKGQRMVVSVFEALKSEPGTLLPDDSYRQYLKAADIGKGERAICDYVAGMTDRFLISTYDRLFSPRMGSVFDRLSTSRGSGA